MVDIGQGPVWAGRYCLRSHGRTFVPIHVRIPTTSLYCRLIQACRDGRQLLGYREHAPAEPGRGNACENRLAEFNNKNDNNNNTHVAFLPEGGGQVMSLPYASISYAK